MNLAAGKYFDHLTLSNINQKMKMLRDQMRQNTNQEISNMRSHIDDFDEKRKQHAFLPNNSSLEHRFEFQENHRSDFNNHQYQIARDPVSHTSHDQYAIAQPQYYRYLTLVEREIDFPELKHLNNKKISAEETRTFIKFVLNQEVLHKLEQLWLQYEDEQQKIDLKTFVNRLFRLGLHYIQAVAVEIPKIKKRVNLKKILFQIAYKYESSSYQKITWRTFKQMVQHYKYEISPTIDTLIYKFEKEKQRTPKNQFIFAQQLLAEIKNIYKCCSADHFLSYCSVKSLIEKLQKSKIIHKHLNTEVRRKSHLQTAAAIKDVISYIKKKSPAFIDLDEFILYFSTHPFAFYPIEERESLQEQQSVSRPKKNSNEKRIKTIKSVASKEKSGSMKQFMQTFNLHHRHGKESQSPDLNQNQQNENQLEQMQFKFKARPVPKSLSKQKYNQFLSTLSNRKQQMRKKEMKEKQLSERVLERMKSQTKLLNFPKRSQYSPVKAQAEQAKSTFKARAIPQTVLSPRIKEIEQEKSSRKNKILSLTVQKYKQSWQELPCVATHRNYYPKKQDKKQDQGEEASIQHHYAKEIPDYNAEHQKMQQQLQDKKKRFKPTQVQQFYFHTQQRHPDPKCKHQTQPIYHQPHQQQHQYDYKKYLYSPEPEIYYTQKHTDMIIANKNREYQRQLSLNQKLREQQERIKRHQNFAKFMKAPLSKIPNTAKLCQLEGKTKIQRHKKYWKKLDIQYENDLNQIYTKVIKRPFLYQMQSGHTKTQRNRIESNESPQQKKKKKPKNKPKYSQQAQRERQNMNKSL